MTHTYNITGMTCTGCQAKVQHLLSQVEGIKNINIDLAKGEAGIEMDKHISTDNLKYALKDYPKYQLSDAITISKSILKETSPKKSWVVTYKPILLIFGYISVISITVGNTSDQFDTLLAMRIFMSGFFLIFSFFKMLDLNGFAESYSMYDIVAKKIKQWGFVYAFVELGLGLSYAINFYPFATNIVSITVMTVSIIGVLQSVLNKKKIQCACLGAVFNLPMSTVTIIEDGLMIIMSALMLLLMK